MAAAREKLQFQQSDRTTMNYRHAFHAGNFADVMKHALLVRILVYLQRKETPLRKTGNRSSARFPVSMRQFRRTRQPR